MNTALSPPSSLPQAQPTPSPAAPSNDEEKDHALTAAAGKTMHPQGAQAATFGQSQNVFPNMNAAHSHPNAQQNHFTMSNYNMGAIQPSNHPVANQQQSNAGGPQLFNPSKSASYSSSFQGNIGHQTHQNQTNLPPVTQALPPTTQQPVQHSSVVSSGSSSNSSTPTTDVEKPQANGTSEVSSTPAKAETLSSTENHISSLAPQPAQTPQISSPQNSEKSKSPVSTTSVPEHPKAQVQESKKPIQETPQPAPVPSSVPATHENGAEKAPVVKDTPPAPSESSIGAAEGKETPKDSAPTTTTTTAAATVTPPQPEETSTVEKDSPAESAVSVAEPSQSGEAGGESRLEQDALEAVEEVAVDADKAEEQLSSPAQSPKKDPLALPTKPSTSATTTPSPVRAVRKAKTVAAKAAALVNEPKTPTAGSSLQRSPSTVGKTKRQRIRTQHYQSPLPEIEIVTKMTSVTPRSRGTDDKLIYFYKNEFLAVRNSEGSFYICQAVQNIYKSSSKIKIRWLSQDKDDTSGELYTPDFYDLTDFDCILTSLELQRVDKGKFRLKPAEKERTDSILKRCLAVEKGEIVPPSLSEEHPDGLDLSLYKDEEQLKKKGSKRKSRPASKSPAKKVPATKKTPEAAKVKKVDPKVTKKTAPPLKKATAPPPAKKPTPVEQKKQATVGSKAAKGKRKAPAMKTSPVLDQKKAKVLAKIGRKTAIPVASTSKSSVPATKLKGAKTAPKPTPSTSKAATKPLKATDRKAKRSSRK